MVYTINLWYQIPASGASTFLYKIIVLILTEIPLFGQNVEKNAVFMPFYALCSRKQRAFFFSQNPVFCTKKGGPSSGPPLLQGI